MHNRRCPRCAYRGTDFIYVAHSGSHDGKFNYQDYFRCPKCGAQSTALDKRRPRPR